MAKKISRRRFLGVSAATIAGAVASQGAGPLFGGIAAAQPAAGHRSPTGLLTSLLHEGLGVPVDRPRFSWQVADLGPNTRQTHYQIQVATSPARLRHGPWVWNSGRVASSDSVAVPYAGPALAPRTAYWWRVRTFAGPRASDWSEPALLATEIGADGWAGDPIWVPAAASPTDGTYSVRVLIKEFCAGLWFRTSSPSETYLWQIVAGSPGRIRPHVFTGGSYRLLTDRPISVDVPFNSPVDISIEMSGPVFRTYVNGVLVDTTTDTTHASGTVGLRNGSAESQAYDFVRFVDADGRVLLEDDFATDRGTFGTGTVSDGMLLLGHSQSGLAAALGPDDSWALLRNEFSLPDTPVEAAVLHVAGLSPEPAHQYVARVWCNGRQAGFGSVRAPAGEARYQSFDVTRLLRPGARNALAALCYTTSDKRFLGQLEITFADGRRQTVATGPHWRARRQAGLLPDRGDLGGGYYHAPQEYWDMRAEPVGWQQAGFDDSGWQQAITRDPIDNLRPALIEPVEVVDVTPTTVRKVADGHWLVDLGREIVGGLALEVTGRAGQTVEVRLGEELSGLDAVRYQLRTGNTYREVWTLRDGRQRVEHWGYRGFRYAELICDPDLDLSHAVTGRAQRVHWNDTDAAFTSSNPDLDRVYEFCRYSIEATRGDLRVDSVTRERGPYEGDVLVTQRSEYAVARSYALIRYTDYYLCRRPTWPTEYRLMSVLSAWYDYLHTGDPDQLASDYDLFVAKNLTRFLGPDTLVHKSPGQTSHDLGDLVDWPVACRDGYVFTDVNTVINAYQYAAYDALANVATALGRSDDAATWRDLADRMAAAIRAGMLDAGAGRFRDGLGTDHSAQHATAYPVALGLGPADLLGKLGDTLAAGGMRVSVFGAQLLLDALFACGRADAAIALMTSRDTNSWLHMLDDLGATIVTEAWDPALKPNMTFSHPWASAPANVIARHVLGVQVTAPGAAAVDVRPRPGPLSRLSGRVPTIRGPVDVSLDRDADGTRYRLDVAVPPNTTARVIVELGEDDPAAYHLAGDHARAARRVDRDVTGWLLVVGPVGSGRIRVFRDQRGGDGGR